MKAGVKGEICQISGKKQPYRAAWVAQWFSAAFSPGPDPGDRDGVPRWTPCMEPASPYACVSASLPVSLMNK